jgi:hypothetical protein
MSYFHHVRSIGTKVQTPLTTYGKSYHGDWVIHIRMVGGSFSLANNRLVRPIMMCSTVTKAIVLASLVTRLSPGGGRLDASQTSKGSLDALTHKTGWVLLGGLTKDAKKWAFGVGIDSDPTVDYPTGSFEILGRTVDRQKPELPKKGERIRLTARAQVTILDYATTGETRRLTAPSSLSRSLGAGDRTGIWIDAGTVVHVQDVQISRPYGQLRNVWARVTLDTR